MKKFIFEEKFKQVVADYKLAVLICKNIDNHLEDENICRKLLDDAQKQSLKFIENEDVSTNEGIQIWRDAYSKFKTKKGAILYGSFLIYINPQTNKKKRSFIAPF